GKTPDFVLDLDTTRFDVSGRVMELAERFQTQVATLNCAKGAVPESSPQFVGTYAGIASSPATRDAIEGSDCLLTVGYRRVETTVGFFTDKLPASSSHLNSAYVDTADKSYQGVYVAELCSPYLTRLRASLRRNCQLPHSSSRPSFPRTIPSPKTHIGKRCRVFCIPAM